MDPSSGAPGSEASPSVNTPADAINHTEATAVPTRRRDTRTETKVRFAPIMSRTPRSRLEAGIRSGGRRRGRVGRRGRLDRRKKVRRREQAQVDAGRQEGRPRLVLRRRQGYTVDPHETLHVAQPEQKTEQLEELSFHLSRDVDLAKLAALPGGSRDRWGKRLQVHPGLAGER